jgi:hypothetical protein
MSPGLISKGRGFAKCRANFTTKNADPSSTPKPSAFESPKRSPPLPTPGTATPHAPPQPSPTISNFPGYPSGFRRAARTAFSLLRPVNPRKRKARCRLRSCAGSLPPRSRRTRPQRGRRPRRQPRGSRLLLRPPRQTRSQRSQRTAEPRTTTATASGAAFGTAASTRPRSESLASPLRGPPSKPRARSTLQYGNPPSTPAPATITLSYAQLCSYASDLPFAHRGSAFLSDLRRILGTHRCPERRDPPQRGRLLHLAENQV